MGEAIASSKWTPEVRRLVVKRLVQLGVYVIITSLILFGTAGTINWFGAWAYLAVYLGMIAVNAAFILPRNPELIAERAEAKENVKGWDRILVPLIVYGCFVGGYVVAGLDKRFGWTGEVPAWVIALGLVFVAAAYALTCWAMITNSFFAAYVRIQDDGGHHVITTGPYAYIRHPAYAAGNVAFLGFPMLLGTYYAFIPAVLGAVLTIVRTALEDRTLQAELPGYKEYAGRVHYRLLPGIW